MDRSDQKRMQDEAWNDAWDEALRASHREAQATLTAAVAAFLWFWGTLFLFLETGGSVFGLPLWFAASVVGGWVLTTAASWWLTYRVFAKTPIEVPGKPEAQARPDDRNEAPTKEGRP